MNRFSFSIVMILLTAGPASPQVPEPGLARELAEHRSASLSGVEYDLFFRIPADRGAPIDGDLTLRFTLSDLAQPLVLDFDAPNAAVQGVSSRGRAVPFELVNGHIVIPSAVLQRGANELAIRFTAGDGPLNRNPDFLYTLFVPDRASNAFPSFDQPDLKAVYRLTLEVPAEWEAVANGAELSVERIEERRRIRFAPTRPISTYLFSFAAGRFQVETAERDGRALRMYHRETDSAKVARNRDAIFDLHAAALGWLEDYTGIAYPFDRFDFVLIPSFQYGGMEHPGAILYNASSLLLEAAATQSEQLGRASLIAHETAHMWFGDLVTMRWFDDVWMKEVFANFMAAKIVNPSFPEIDHELRFLLAHHPAAYGVDRTAGTHPIRQQLDNLNEAGSLYGAIIYQKAPIAMRQLETLIGEAEFREGMREYLRTFAYGNATWHDLIAVLDRRSPLDLTAWSRIWVEEPGRPAIRVAADVADGRLRSLTLHQADESGAGRVWPQRVDVLLGAVERDRILPVLIAGDATRVREAEGLPAPRYILPDARGLGYARFVLDEATRQFLADSLPSVRTHAARGVAVLALHDAMLEGELRPQALLRTLRNALHAETEQLLIDRYLGTITNVFWTFLTPMERADLAGDLEALLWSKLGEAPDASARATWFAALRNIALTDGTIGRLRSIWAGTDSVPGLPLAERDFTALAQALALRGVPDAPDILARQLERIDNPDRRARFEFIMPALAADTVVRDAFFESLSDVRNRSHEPWVLDALAALNHPLRADHAVKYIRPGLDLLPEIRRTGDIFFPRRWAGALLGGHASPDAASRVHAFLAESPDLPVRLRWIVHQAADDLFRAAHMAPMP